MKKTFDLLVFDWDGTLINSIAWIVECIQQAALSCAYKKPDIGAVRGIIGLSLGEAMSTLFPGASKDTTAKLVNRYRELYCSKNIQQNDLFFGVADMLVSLRGQGYLLAVATGKGRVGLNAAMCATSTEDLFDATRCSDETASKPDPMMLLQIMDQLGVNRNRTLMIGDTVHDLKMAQNAGVSAIAVSCGADGESALNKYAPLYCLSNTVELMGSLELLPGRLSENKNLYQEH